MLSALSNPAAAQVVQNGSVFNSSGPGPRFGSANAVQSADQSPNGTEAGAIQAILPDPALGANTYYVASPNGGVWVTTNAGATWTPLTDNQASLSIASLGLDPTDPAGKTIIAGIGLTSNGSWNQTGTLAGRGGARDGILYSTDGGATWSLLGSSVLKGQSVIGVEARGSTILAGTFEEQEFTTTQTGAGASYGLYRSTNGGSSFTLVSGAAGSGLPAGAVSSLVANPSNPNQFFAAVTSVNTPNQTAVYVSSNQGITWSPVFTQTNSAGTIVNNQQTVLTLATGPNGAIVVAVSNVSGGVFAATLSGVFLSPNGGATWNQLNTANVIPGGQSPVNLHLAIDPTNTNIVFISGDAHQTCGNTPPTSFCSLFAGRIVFNPNTLGSTFTSLTFEGTGPLFSNANTVHADSRAMAFDSQGNLILSSDGGIYLRNNPTGAGSWQGMNGNLQVLEPYTVAFDANSKLAAVAAQDNGSSLQAAPGSSLYNAVNVGDGTIVAFNDRTLANSGLSVLYSATQSIGFLSRMLLNSAGQVVSPFPDPTNPGGVLITCDGGQDCGVEAGGYFSSPLVLNKIDPTRIAFGGNNGTFVTVDPLTNVLTATTIDLSLTNVGNAHPVAIAYGTQDNTSALLVAGVNGYIWLSTATGTPSLQILPNYAGQAAMSVSFDLRTQQRFFVADTQDLWYVTNGTAAAGSVTFTKETANLPASFVRPTSLEFISNNGVNALLVGGLNTPLTCTSAPNGCVISSSQSPITVADSDASGNLSGWRAFGQGLPNALVSTMSYNPTVDVLVAGLVGRGVFTLYDVTSNFAQATVLQFGLANNDSNPDASILTNGTVGSRPLIKYGTGTLTIAGTATYTGGTTIEAGTMILGNGGAGGSIIGNVAFCSNSGDPSCDTSSDKIFGFNRSDVYTFAGSISGPGTVVQFGSGTTILTGASNYSGPTAVDGGTLIVNGSITSQVAVNPGGTLSGTGTVGATNINNGGVLAPGNPTGILTVQGNLVFASAASYLIQIGPAGAGKTNVVGTATLGGTVIVAPLPNAIITHQYDILNATAGLNGSFLGVVAPNYPALNPSLAYGPNDVFLNLSLNYNSLRNLNSNQQAVGNALTNFFNSTGSIPAIFVGLTSSGLQQIAGETATGALQTTYQAMNTFINTLLDPFIDGRTSNGASQGRATPYAEEADGADAYAAKGGARSGSERDAYAMAHKAPFLNTVYDPHWSVWAAGFGGSQTTDGNAAAGSNTMSSRIYGTAVGADYLISPRSLVGFALAGGGTSYSVNNFGTGRSDLFQAGVFVRHTVGQAYVSGALAYGWQNVSTDRIVTAAGFDHLQANFNANTVSGRVEGGYRVVMPWLGGFGITPYAAGQFTAFMLPSYAERAVVGTNNFALGYGSQSVTDTRSELGVRTDKSFAVTGGVLTLRGRLAWAHDFDPNRAVSATFQTLPGASFVTNGAAMAPDSALTTASAEMKWLNGWAAAATVEGEFSSVTSAYTGKGVVRYTW